MIITLLEYFHKLNIHFQSQGINLLTKINLSQTYFIIFHTLVQLMKILLNYLNYITFKQLSFLKNSQ
jgi:hypothetical protein